MAVAQQGISQQTGDGMPALQRPINRLPVRKLSSDSKEAMNCKSCRKRKVSLVLRCVHIHRTDVLKIKCNRLKPSCEACQVFNSTCVYGMQSEPRCCHIR